MTRTCTRCRIAKPVEEFPLNRTKRGTAYRHGRCGDCRREQVRVQSKTEHARAGKRRRSLARFFGLTVEAFDAMAARQGGGCAICGQPETKRHYTGKLLSLSVDHEHGTGRIRSLLCSQCNVGLGSFKDSPERLRAAAEYIERHRANQ